MYATALVHWVQDHRCDVRLWLYGMIYLPSASAMDVKLQSPEPQLTSGERQVRREEGPGKGRRGKFSWSKVGGMFQSEWDMRYGPARMLSPPGPPLWLSTGLEVDSKSLSQSIRLIDLVSRLANG